MHSPFKAGLMPTLLRTLQACPAIEHWFAGRIQVLRARACRKPLLLLALMSLVNKSPLIPESRAWADASTQTNALDAQRAPDTTKTKPQEYFLNFPDGIFLSSKDDYHAFALNLASTPDELRCQIESASWTCKVLKIGISQRVAIVILERIKTEQEAQVAADLEQPTAVITLTAAAGAEHKVVRTILREPTSRPRIMQNLGLRILRIDNKAESSAGQTPNFAGERQKEHPQMLPIYSCRKVGEERVTDSNPVEIFWLDDRARILSRGPHQDLDSSLIPGRTKSIRCIALGQRNSSFQTNGDSSLGTVMYGISPTYHLTDVFRPKNPRSSDWIIFNGKPVTQTVAFKSLTRLPKGAKISCFLGSLNQERHLSRSVCEPSEVNLNSQTDFRVTVRLDPHEVAALWDNAQSPTHDRYSPRLINLRVINTGSGPRYFGDRELLILRANYAPTVAIRSLDANQISVSVQDPEKDHLIAATHDGKQKPWQAPGNQVWSSWSAAQSSLSPRNNLRFEVDRSAVPSCQITASDGVLVATKNCREIGKRLTDATSESSLPPDKSLLSLETNSTVKWSNAPTGPGISKASSNVSARFESLTPSTLRQVSIESLPYGQSIRSGFCIGLSGKCDLNLARNGRVEMRSAESTQVDPLWMVGLNIDDERLQLRILETFQESQSPIKNLETSKDLADMIAQNARSIVLPKASPKRSSGKEFTETQPKNPGYSEIICLSAPELTQTCRDIQSMLLSSDSIFATISFQIRSEIRGSKVILALLKLNPDETPAEETGINTSSVNQSSLQSVSFPSILILGNIGSPDKDQIPLMKERK